MSGAYEGAGRLWNSLESGDPVTDQAFIDLLERVWLAAIGVEPALDLVQKRPVDRVR
ncbi:hypothetical protein [Beijerinckia sp. L45]|uniref:hypothetical protein n=1 Tax=Beijerinckia sp. L45 TaxID=1641855 RepID=UPI00131E6175|nr:hypothetical protein [Beijerinckia sp. L45]